LAGRTAYFAKGAPSTPKGREQFLLFTIAGEVMGVGIGSLREAIYSDGLQDFPAFPYCGQIHYQGKRIPVVKLAELFDYPTPAGPDLPCILVTMIGGVTLGLLVEGVQEVVEVDPREIEPMPEMATLLDQDYFRGLLRSKGRIVVLINESALTRLEGTSHFEEFR